MENLPKTVFGIGYSPSTDRKMVQSVNDRFKIGTKFLHKSLLSFYAAVVPRFTQPVVIFRRRPVSVGDPLDDLAVYFAVVTVRRNAFDVENDAAGGSCHARSKQVWHGCR